MQFASNRVYAKVERTLPERGYCFARVTEPEELKVFVHFSRARLVERQADGLWLAEEVEKRQPQPGDCLFMVIEHGEQGYRARYWGFDPAPRLWNYRDLMYRHWPQRQKSAVIAFRDFLNLCRREAPGYEGFRKDYLDCPEEQAFVSRLALAYADECVDKLLAAGRPYLAIAELEMLDIWRHGLKLDIDVNARLTRAKLGAMSTSVNGGLEELIKRMREERNAGRPNTALHLCKQVTSKEDAVVERQCKQSRQRGPIVGAEWQLIRSRFAPISTSFEQDAAMVNLYQTCLDASIQQALDMRREINELLDTRDGYVDSEAICGVWFKYHDADEHFKDDDGLRDIICDLINLGLVTELRILEGLMSSRADVYDYELGLVRSAIPRGEPSKGAADRFATAEKYLRRAIDERFADLALAKYERFVVNRGDSFLFSSRPERDQLIRDLRAQAPMDALCGSFNHIANTGTDAGDAMEKMVIGFIQASAELKLHPAWTESVLVALSLLEGRDDGLRQRLAEACPEVAAAALTESRRKAERDRQIDHGRWI